MKKLIAFLLAVIMLLSLCACGKSDAVKNVEELISNLGNITIDSEELIINAENAYAALTEKEKGKVENYETLLNARKEYDAIPKEIEVEIENEVFAVVLEKTLLGEYEYSDYVINEKGQITDYYRGGKDKSTYHREYNDDGTLASEESTNHYGFEKVNYIYDDEGHLVRECWTSDWSIQNGKEFTYTYTFDDEGRIATKVSENVLADYVTVYGYTYDENNRLIRQSEQSDTSTYISEFVYDESGNVIEERVSELNNPNNGWTNTYVYECVGTYTTYEMRPVK